ncbi:MAG: hypothetical protein JNM56_22365 [Planctomycetia bacterium]|nr:hypothetical protein [Planctomycetia bacterium]
MDAKTCGSLRKPVPLGRESLSAKPIVVDRGGFGVRIEVKQTYRVYLGERDTVLIQLADTPTPASKGTLRCLLVLFGA